MPRRKKRWWKPNINTSSIQSTIALTTMLFGILLLITTLASFAGYNNELYNAFYFLFGITVVLLPFNLILLGLSLTKLKQAIAQPRPMWGFLIITTSFTILFGIFSKTAGGWFGHSIASAISTYITAIGTFFFSITLFIIGIIILFNTSLQELTDLIQNLSEKLQPMMNSVKILLGRKESEGVVAESTENTIPEIIINEPNRDNDIEIIEDSNKTPGNSNQLAKPISTTQDKETVPEDLPYEPPPLTLLNDAKEATTDHELIEKNAKVIEETLNNFGIQARIAEVNVGPSVTQYAINLAEGIRTNKITSLQNDLAMSLASPTGSVRIEAPIPGKRLIGIEVPNTTLSTVTLKSLLVSQEMRNSDSKLSVGMGEDVSGKPVIANVLKWPHILIAGATGSGKSVLLHSIIQSILFRATPTEVSFIMVDPKRVELSLYNGIPHLQTPVIVDSDKTINAFKWAVDEMERRYKLFQQLGVRNLQDFNKTTDTPQLPYVIMIVDELADLMAFAANEMEMLITRIAQKARATGIFMILATQRPSVDVITGLIKANIPTRVSLTVTSGTDSRVIIDTVGAEKLLGKGDMFYLPSDAGKPRRVQSAFLSNEEIERVASYLKQFPSPYVSKMNTYSTTQSVEEDDPIVTTSSGTNVNTPDDDKFVDAIKVILNHEKASASLLQRRLKVGYARAARLLDELEERGVVTPPDGSNPRQVNKEVAMTYIQTERPSSAPIAQTEKDPYAL